MTDRVFQSAEEREVFWLSYWACFGKSMAGWLAFTCVLLLVADTSYATPFSITGGWLLWAAMAAVWSIDQGDRAVRRWRDAAAQTGHQ